MRYRVRAENREFEIEVRDVEGRTTIRMNGRPVEVCLEEAAPGVYTLLIEGKAYDTAVVRRSDGYGIAVQGVPFEVAVEDGRRGQRGSPAPARPVADGQVPVRAPMPGLVLQVTVAEGDLVEKGQRLVVLEAMKMENDMVAPRAGRVQLVKVATGQIVEQGQLLVLLE